MVDVTVVVPAVDGGLTSSGLRHLTRVLADRGFGQLSAGLGGSDGYGIEFSNDVFVMRPFFWGDCDCGFEQEEAKMFDSHPHSSECFQTALAQAYQDHTTQLPATPKNTNQTIPGPLDNSFVLGFEQRRVLAQPVCARFDVDMSPGWSAVCTCGVDCLLDEWELSHSHADSCSLMLPNFRHLKSGLEVRWYKYIGRDMEVSGHGDFVSILAECVQSLPQ